jgi:hypothetical protein
MSTQTAHRVGLRRPAAVGFLVGFATAFVATVLALMSPFFETLEPVLVPGALLLEPLTERMAGWNGLLNMVLGGVANGLVYAVVFAAAALALGAVRRPGA